MARFSWDTNQYVYLFEGNPLFYSAVATLRRQMLLNGDELLTAALTLGEIQVKALNEGKLDFAAELKRLVLASSQIVPFDANAGDAFAYIRTTTRIKGADAFQLACAMAVGVDFFITNDTDLPNFAYPASVGSQAQRNSCRNTNLAGCPHLASEMWIRRMPSCVCCRSIAMSSS